MATRVTSQLTRSDSSIAWGLRISGGRDFGAPITIQRVVPGGLAERGGVCAGDVVIEICGAPVSPMCHRDAQQAIKNAGNTLKLELERTALRPPGPARSAQTAAADNISSSLRNLQVKGAAVETAPTTELGSAINTTAQPWRPRKSIDNTDARPPVKFGQVSATLPSRVEANKEPSGPPERKFSSGPMPFQAPVASVSAPTAYTAGLRKTTDQGTTHGYQPSSQTLPSKDQVDFNRYQPSSASLARPRASEPYIPAYQRNNGGGDEQAPVRKVSDVGPAPFVPTHRSLPHSGPPTVAPKPPAERRLSLERGSNWQSPHGEPAKPLRSSAAVAAAAAAAANSPLQSGPVAHEHKAPPKQSPGVCFHCKDVIRGPYLLALERAYCADHFRCAKCDEKLDKQPFIAHEDLVYCVKDYGTYVAPRCANCREPVVIDQLKAMDQVYHPQCFVCAMCKQPIAAGSFRLGTDNLPYCEKDWKANFQVICYRCNFPIEPDERFIEAMSKSFHAECFCCTTCQTKLEGKPFYNRNDNPYCREHINAH